MNDEVSAEQRRGLSRLVMGAMATHALGLAVRLGLPDAIGDGVRDAAELAAEHATPEDTMLRLLRAVTSLGLFEERQPGRFALTGVGSLLRRDHPESVFALARMFTDPVMLEGWRHLERSVRTGSTSFEVGFGVPFFDRLAAEPELSALFNASMAQGTRAVAGVLPGSYDFGRHDTVVDVGGGNGALLAAILREHPEPRGVVFDTPAGAGEASRELAEAGLATRTSVTTGDFFDAVPAGAGLYLLKSVLHDWDDDRAVLILRHCREALADGGRVLIVEPVLPEVVPPDAPAGIYLSDLNMLVNVGGRERTRTDFEHLCARSGLVLASVAALPGATGFCVLEAVADRDS